MKNHESTNPDVTVPASTTASDPLLAGSYGGANAAMAKRPAWARVTRLFAKRITWVVAAALTAGVIALTFALGGSNPTAAAAPAPVGAAAPVAGAAPARGAGGAGPLAGGGGGSNARSGPAAGGSSGTVSSVTASSFTLTTSAGQKVTVNEASSTTYQDSSGSISASGITAGEPVLVLGTTNGTTITASQVTVQPAGSDGSAASSAAGVVPFQQGAPSAAKSVGQIPAGYTEGSGTIVSGTTANKATEAALAAYPGGVVDRVVQLSTGQYEVHYIGVNWPHHIFVNQDFTVAGAN
jgi:hypothetical protein